MRDAYELVEAEMKQEVELLDNIHFEVDDLASAPLVDRLAFPYTIDNSLYGVRKDLSRNKTFR